MRKKPVAVVDLDSGKIPGQRLKVLRRFNTVREAEHWVGARKDIEKVLRGGYGIDAPEDN